MGEHDRRTQHACRALWSAKAAPSASIAVNRTEPTPFSETQIELLKTFARQAVIAIENARLFEELENRNKAVTEALEQQTATSEILRVISGSPTDARPVFETIVQSATRLCGAEFAVLHRYDGERVTADAYHSLTEQELDVVLRVFPRPAQREYAAGRAILDGDSRPHPRHSRGSRIPDQRFAQHHWLHRRCWRCRCSKSGRRSARYASGVDRHLRSPKRRSRWSRLLPTRPSSPSRTCDCSMSCGAQQALTEALEQQTATSEILRVISSSPTDLQPVLEHRRERDAAVRDAERCEHPSVDGDDSAWLGTRARLPPSPWSASPALPRPRGGRAILDRAVLHVFRFASGVERGIRAAQKRTRLVNWGTARCSRYQWCAKAHLSAAIAIPRTEVRSIHRQAGRHCSRLSPTRP